MNMLLRTWLRRGRRRMRRSDGLWPIASDAEGERQQLAQEKVRKGHLEQEMCQKRLLGNVLLLGQAWEGLMGCRGASEPARGHRSHAAEHYLRQPAVMCK